MSRSSLQSPLPRWVPVGLDAPAQAASTRRLTRVPATAPSAASHPGTPAPSGAGSCWRPSIQSLCLPARSPGTNRTTLRYVIWGSQGPISLSRAQQLTAHESSKAAELASQRSWFPRDRVGTRDRKHVVPESASLLVGVARVGGVCWCISLGW